MVERIRLLLETRQLSPTQFADAIGVARPIVSHILSGRNKPSLEVVQRILAAMPDLSMAWLLNGTGTMLAAIPAVPAAASRDIPPPSQPTGQVKEAGSTVGAVPPQATAKATLKPVVNKLTAKQESAAEPLTRTPLAPTPALRRFTPTNAGQILVGSGEAIAASGQKEQQKAQPPEAAVLPTPSASIESSPPSPDLAAQLMAGAEKPIRRIVIFYKDGSFADYQPE